MSVPAGSRVGAAIAFARAAARYWLGVFPCARRELRHWRLRAAEIRDPELRRLAFDALCAKRDSLEGAVAFATFAPSSSRAVVIRAITAYQLAFDYIDELSEQPGADPIANGRQLNQALMAALESDARHADYYAHNVCFEDTGYLRDLVDTCRTALQILPSYEAIVESLRSMTTRIVTYQSLNHGDARGSYAAFTRWARAETRESSGLSWWETGAAAGSPLPIFALIATAAKPAAHKRDAAAVEGLYYPWIASLSSLLDSLIDRREDLLEGQRSLIDYYASTAEVATRLQSLTAESLRRAGDLSDPGSHKMILAAMAGFFHTTPQASAPDIRFVTQRIMDTVSGDFACLATPVLRVRGAIARSVHTARGVRRFIRHANRRIGTYSTRRTLASSTGAIVEARRRDPISRPGGEEPAREGGASHSRA
jgi:tetraprenyl-beta-curcumene synthase